jgi:hypothetical protein
VSKILVYHIKDLEAPSGRSLMDQIGWGSLPINFGENHELVAAVETTRIDEGALDEAYRLTQNINHPWPINSEVEIKATDGRKRFRSTHIGDVLVIGSTPYVCSPVGWEQVTSPDQKIVRG